MPSPTAPPVVDDELLALVEVAIVLVTLLATAPDSVVVLLLLELLLAVPPLPVASPLALQPKTKEPIRHRELRATPTNCIDGSSR